MASLVSDANYILYQVQIQGIFHLPLTEHGETALHIFQAGSPDESTGWKITNVM